MLERLRSVFTKRNAAAAALIGAAAAACVGWKMGSDEAIGRYLTAPVTLTTIL